MSCYRTYKASDVGSVKVEPMTITAHRPPPSHKSIKVAARAHRREGRMVADALWHHLPGGTVDQILLRLLERRASLLRVRF